MPSVFICHASEDKDAVARPLAYALRDRHIEVWFDEFSIKVGDSLREAIDRGLVNCDYGIVIVSKAFFLKRWTQRELNGLVAREMAGTRTLVLPVWHDVDRDFVLNHSPSLADVYAVSSEIGTTKVIEQLLRTIRPLESPLVIAREELAKFDLDTPSVSDDWWLDISEMKQSLFAHPDCTQRWIFPLPYSTEDDSFKRGQNLASTAMQLDWCYAAEEQGLCQLSHPDKVHSFLKKMPGLLDTSRQNLGTLAIYAPQLTVPGFDSGFEDLFDELLGPDRNDAYEMPGYGGKNTIDGEAPLCGELIAWRHNSFGGFTKEHLAYSFVHSHDGQYSRFSYSTFDCMAWLLSEASRWMPHQIKIMLIEGLRDKGFWFHDIAELDNGLSAAMFNHGRKGFKSTRSVRAGAEALFEESISRLEIEGSASAIANRFFELDFVDAWYAANEFNRAARSRH
ncbi:toll/interleukin-1 receptor domain-containing protein [Parasphingorhabdus sp.]|uniref:toll/interleukin-1 receptor domain-containing protein n=1 Tax=Parasphingorhabdus sp. TaxID=2709688 RepID=UPI003D2DD2FA